MLHQKKWRLTVLSCAVAYCCCATAFASNEQEVAQPEDSQQAPTSASNESMDTLDTVVVTATRQEQSILDVPATVSVITRSDMQRHNVNDMRDLVRYEPGISVKQTVSGTDPFGNLTGFTIRGVGGNRVQMLVDGSRIIESIQDGNRDFVDLSMMKSVEIMRGPGSVLWGADAMGGIVSYQTMDPEDLLRGRKVGATVSAGYNSLNKGQTYTAMVAAQMTPTLQGIAGYTYRKYSETRLTKARADGGIWGCNRIGIGCDKLNPLDGESNNFMAKLVWSPNAYHQVKLTGETFVSDADVEQLFDKNQVSMGYKNGDYFRNQKQSRWRLALEHEWLVDAGWLDELKWKLSYSPQKRELSNRRYQKRVLRGVERITYQDTDYSEDFVQGEVQLTSRFDTGSVKHELTYGFQGDITKSKYDRVTTTVTGGVPVTVHGGGLDFVDAKTKRYDLFIQDQIGFADGKLTVTPGLRWANYKIDPSIDQYYNVIAGKEPQKISSHKLIPQISFTFKPHEEYTLYARYAEGFKMPTVQQLYTSYSNAMGSLNIVPNPDLKPEKVKSFEVGIRRAFNHHWWSIAAYYNDYSDFIKSQQLIAGTANDYTSQNISKVKIWGIEASGSYELHRDWRLNGGIAYMHGKQRDNGDNGYIAFDGASPVNGYLGVQWYSPQRFVDAELIANFSGPMRRVTNAGKYQPSGYTVFDGYLNFHPTKKVHLSMGVQNIFDKRYFLSYASTIDRVPASASTVYTAPLELYTGAGRSFTINAKVDF